MATLQMKTGEIECCDIDIVFNAEASSWEHVLVDTLERLGARKGSRLIVEGIGREVPFGVTEGMALYLNGTELPAEIYRECDANHVYSEFNRLLGQSDEF